MSLCMPMGIRRCPSMENNGDDAEKEYSRYSLSCCSSSREEGFHFPGTDQHHYYSGVFFDLINSSDSDDADESFIEISLERHQPPLPPPPSGHDQQTAVAAAAAVDQEEKEAATHGEDDDDDHLEFRISFSSPTAAACLFSPPHQHVDDVTPQPPQAPQCLLPSTSSASVTTTIDPASVSSSSSSSLSSSMEVNEPDLPKISDSNNSEGTSSRMGCRVRFPEEHDDNVMMGHTPTLSFSCLRAFSAVNRRDEGENLHDEEAIIIEDCNAGHHRHHGTAARVHSWKLLRSRKVTKVKTAINGGIMKLFIKFRSIKIRSVLSSYMKTREEDVSDSQHHSFSLTGCSNTIFEEDDDDDGGGGMANMRPVKRWMPSSSQLRDHMSKNMNDGCNDIGGYGSFSSFSNIKRTTGGKVGTRKAGNISKVVTRSCPSSVKCSPIHKSSNYNKEVVMMRSSKIYTIQENSVEAAIAYCKGSIV